MFLVSTLLDTSESRTIDQLRSNGWDIDLVDLVVMMILVIIIMCIITCACTWRAARLYHDCKYALLTNNYLAGVWCLISHGTQKSVIHKALDTNCKVLDTLQLKPVATAAAHGCIALTPSYKTTTKHHKLLLATVRI